MDEKKLTTSLADDVKNSQSLNNSVTGGHTMLSALQSSTESPLRHRLHGNLHITQNSSVDNTININEPGSLNQSKPLFNIFEK